MDILSRNCFSVISKRLTKDDTNEELVQEAVTELATNS